VDKFELEKRTKTFALRVIQFVANLPRNKVADVLGYQVLKSGTAVGANYREANRAESRKDFIHKIGIVEKEASETQYWLELLEESDIGSVTERQWLLRESGELIAIFTSIGKTAKNNIGNTKSDSSNSQPADHNSRS
jgi:four helix bundle protein